MTNTTGMKPGLAENMTRLDTNIRKMPNISSDSTRLRAFFGQAVGATEKQYKLVSPGHCRPHQSKNIINSILALLSHQAQDCLGDRASFYQEMGTEIYGSFLSRNKDKPIGIFFDENKNYLYAKVYEGGTTPKMEYDGETAFFVHLPDRTSAIEILACLYDECKCEKIGHKDVCPIYGLVVKDHENKMIRDLLAA